MSGNCSVYCTMKLSSCSSHRWSSSICCCCIISLSSIRAWPPSCAITRAQPVSFQAESSRGAESQEHFVCGCSDLHAGAPQRRVLRSVRRPRVGGTVAASPNSSSDAGVDRRLKRADGHQVFDFQPKPGCNDSVVVKHPHCDLDVVFT